MSVIITKEMMLQRLKDKGIEDVKYVSNYTALSHNAIFQCIKTGIEYEDTPRNILTYGHCSCPNCMHEIKSQAAKIRYQKNVLKGTNNLVPFNKNTQEKFEEICKSNNPHWEVIGEYINSWTKIKVKCRDCGYTKEYLPSTLYYYSQCPNCNDGISYPNKFLREVIKQLSIDIQPKYEHSFSWLGRMKLDCYFIYNNQEYAVEMDGGYHYRDIPRRNTDALHQRDILKDQLVKDHNIYMIRIDSQQSDYLYLKNSFYASAFNQLFDLSAINWELCGENAQCNYCKKAWDYFKNHLEASTYDIANALGVSDSACLSYIKKGMDLKLFYHPLGKRPIFVTNIAKDEKMFFDSLINFSRYLNLEENIQLKPSKISYELSKEKPYIVNNKYIVVPFTDFFFNKTRKEEVFNANIFITK